MRTPMCSSRGSRAHARRSSKARPTCRAWNVRKTSIALLWIFCRRNDAMSRRHGAVLLGALFGALVVFMWLAARSEMADTTFALVVIAVLFIAAGLVGALRSGAVAGG